MPSPDSILVRRATESDLPAMSAVMTASIIQLCILDHGNDPAILAGWTANKSLAGVAAMLANPDLRLFVVEHDGEIAAVGSVKGEEIGLNYVAPSHRFKGVSKALLAAMERDMAGRGIEIGRLTSTATARQFYLTTGWIEVGFDDTSHHVTGYPMQKALPAIS